MKSEKPQLYRTKEIKLEEGKAGEEILLTLHMSSAPVPKHLGSAGQITRQGRETLVEK